MARVLIADDSPTVCALLAEVLATVPGLEIVGEAHTGAEAIAMAAQLRPDAVTMDVEMPGMNGYDATKEIMIRVPTPVVIISGHVDDDDLARCSEAFRAGALATFRKLPDVNAPEFEERAAELTHIVSQLSLVKVSRHWRIAEEQSRPARPAAGDNRLRVVVTVVSARGGVALAKLLGKMPRNFAAPVLVIPRLGSGFSEGFVGGLARSSGLQVVRAGHEEALRPGTVYVAPEHVHLTVEGDFAHPFLTLSDAPPVRGFRPSATVLFESTAMVFGPSALALVLPGVGEDGIPGLCSIRLEGGRIIAQEATERAGLRSPGADIAASLADIALPLDLMAAQLQDIHNRLSRSDADPPCVSRSLAGQRLRARLH